MKRTLTLSESLCGFQFVIRHLDGRDLVITRAPGHVVPSGMNQHVFNYLPGPGIVGRSLLNLCIFSGLDSVQIVEGEGMPQYKRPFDKGHLLIKFKVEFPENNFTDETTLKVNWLI